MPLQSLIHENLQEFWLRYYMCSRRSDKNTRGKMSPPLFIRHAVPHQWVTVAYMENIKGLFKNLFCWHLGLKKKKKKHEGTGKNELKNHDSFLPLCIKAAVLCCSLSVWCWFTQMNVCSWFGTQKPSLLAQSTMFPTEQFGLQSLTLNLI